MKPYDWNEQKNAKLKNEREVGFETIVDAINQGNLLETLEHPNKLRYGNQKIYFVQIEEYVYLVPFVEDKDKIFLKTIIPSRKATRKYLKGEK
ncbi:MAG TPA: hypothetical protein VGF75_01555 [Candidatus Saccharimonadales bacterium]